MASEEETPETVPETPVETQAAEATSEATPIGVVESATATEIKPEPALTEVPPEGVPSQTVTEETTHTSDTNLEPPAEPTEVLEDADTPKEDGEEPVPKPEGEELAEKAEGEEPTPKPEGEEPTPKPEGEEPTPKPEGEESSKSDEPHEGEESEESKEDEDEGSEKGTITNMSSSSSSSGSAAHALDGLTDQQLVDMVHEMDQQDRHLRIENTLFINFLKKNDPELLESLDEIIKLVMQVKDQADTHKQDSDTHTLLRSSAARHTSIGSYVGLVNIASGRGPKISLTHKTDMCVKAIEEEQASLESFLKRSHRIERNLRTELEEFSIRESDIKEAINIFEFNVVTQGMDKLTQRIPAEKFVRYMEEWLKSAQGQIEKLRLRIATLKIQYQKVSQQLVQRQELGENVHAVDFDQLEIENKHLELSIEQKNIHTVELKRMNGGANLVLSTHKKYLQKQQKEYNRLKEEIAMKEKAIEDNDAEIARAEEELQQAVHKYENCKKMKTMYKVPEVIEYVKLKSQLHDLQKNIKVWSRRKQIQDIALTTCLRELKSLTGSSVINPEWFEDVISIGGDSENRSESSFIYSRLR